jgi:superfamily II DNA helicase RecQ
MALTATASKKTKKDVFNVLGLMSPFEVVESAS